MSYLAVAIPSPTALGAVNEPLCGAELLAGDKA